MKEKKRKRKEAESMGEEVDYLVVLHGYSN